MKNIKYGLLTVLLIGSVQAISLEEMMFAYEDAVEKRPTPREDWFTGELVQPTEEETASARTKQRRRICKRCQRKKGNTLLLVK